MDEIVNKGDLMRLKEGKILDQQSKRTPYY